MKQMNRVIRRLLCEAFCGGEDKTKEGLEALLGPVDMGYDGAAAAPSETPPSHDLVNSTLTGSPWFCVEMLVLWEW